MTDPHCRVRGDLGKTSKMGPGEVWELLVLSLSVLFSRQVHTAQYLEILTHLNVNQPLPGGEVHP